MIALVACVSCGRVGFAPVLDVNLDDTGIDTSAPFGTAQMIPELVLTGNCDDPTLTADMLELYFINRPAAAQGSIMVSARAAVTDPWGVPMPVAELNSTGDEAGPRIQRDGLAIYFSSTRPGGAGDMDIYVSTRGSRSVPWNPPQRIFEVATAELESGFGVDGSGLFVAFDRGTVNRELYTSSRSSTTAAWSTQMNVVELSTPDDDAVPWLDDAGTTMYFASSRPGLGSRDLYRAHRATTSSAFDPPTRLDDLSSPQLDSDPWLSVDRRTIYFASARTGGVGRIYMATR